MSNFLCDLKLGGEISCQGPFGDFNLRPPMRDSVFIATGTGIAPFRSMLHWLFEDRERHQNRQIWLLFGNRTERDIHYHHAFLELAGKHENFQYLPTLSRGAPEWQGLRGQVQDHLPRIVEDRTDMHAYICGLDKMIKANRDLLRSLGWDRKNIRDEKYDQQSGAMHERQVVRRQSRRELPEGHPDYEHGSTSTRTNGIQ